MCDAFHGRYSFQFPEMQTGKLRQRREALAQYGLPVIY
jgi:hypothetical protein